MSFDDHIKEVMAFREKGVDPVGLYERLIQAPEEVYWKPVETFMELFDETARYRRRKRTVELMREKVVLPDGYVEGMDYRAINLRNPNNCFVLTYNKQIPEHVYMAENWLLGPAGNEKACEQLARLIIRHWKYIVDGKLEPQNPETMTGQTIDISV